MFPQRSVSRTAWPSGSRIIAALRNPSLGSAKLTTPVDTKSGLNDFNRLSTFWVKKLVSQCHRRRGDDRGRRRAHRDAHQNRPKTCIHSRRRRRRIEQKHAKRARRQHKRGETRCFDEVFGQVIFERIDHCVPTNEIVRAGIFIPQYAAQLFAVFAVWRKRLTVSRKDAKTAKE